MSRDLAGRSRAASVPWRDLVPLRRGEVVRELALPLPWLGLSWLCAVHGWWVPALAASFVFFLCGLRLAHGAFHGAIGLRPAGDRWVLHVLSLAMLGSLHAVRWNHLRHHRLYLGDGDIEAEPALRSGWGALALGPRFPWRLHRAALRGGDRVTRRRIRAELAVSAAVVVCALGFDGTAGLPYHVAAMLLGQSLTAFFAVWTVHRGSRAARPVTRTLRGRALAALTAQMFFHREHHLFPAVPTPHLARLARRIDRVAPGFASRRVFSPRSAARVQTE